MKSVDRGGVRSAPRLTVVVCGLFLFCCPVLAQDNVVVNADGTMDVGTLRFASFAEYVQSAYFREQGKRCGTRTPEAAAEDRILRSVDDCTLYLTVIRNEYWPQVIYSVPVWFHVIYRADGTGDIPDVRIRDQITVLNEDFRALPGTMGCQGTDSRIQFTLAGITRTMNDDWYNNLDWEYEDIYKKALNVDPARYVNIYTTSAGGYLGYTYYPHNGVAGQYYDGIVLNSQVVGGRDNELLPLYDQGRTLVHEMGHYLGLFHTFEGQGGMCTNTYSSGDLIVDTPAEAEEHYQCVQTSTCDSLDPIHNYMNYTPDTCMHMFSREQNNRAVCGLINYRPLLYRIAWKPGTGGSQDDAGLSFLPPALLPLLIFGSQ